jgi:hypothetical protein
MTLMKKREILPALDKVISGLVAMSAECAKLEITDNDQASRRLKRSLTSLKNKELKEFTDLIFNIRQEIKVKPARQMTEKQKLNLKTKKTNESESDNREKLHPSGIFE